MKLAFRSQEGVVAVIGERGVGTTSLSNYCRFSQENAYTPKYEIHAEQFSEGIDLLEALVYSIANDIVDRKISSKTARMIMAQYKGNTKDIKVSAKIGGVGLSFGSSKGEKISSPYLVSVLEDLIKDIVRKKTYNFIIFQINNLDVKTGNNDKVEQMLDYMRDIFHTRNTVWYLLGDSSLEALIKSRIDRVSSIVKHWIHVPPMGKKEFYLLYSKRIENSGTSAKSPFTRSAIDKLAEASMGRPRFAFDIAGRLIEHYAELIYPELIDENTVELFAKKEILHILQIDHLSENTLELIKHIAKNPGKSSSELAEHLGIALGNLNKYINPLVENHLITIEKKGRKTCHFPTGYGKLLI
jgi:predicted transcriptional regulator